MTALVFKPFLSEIHAKVQQILNTLVGKQILENKICTKLWLTLSEHYISAT